MSSFPFYITPSEFDEQVAEHELLLKEDESSMRWSSRNVDAVSYTHLRAHETN